MKKVLKKNQIIISALAIMIAVAGYLNFTKDKTKEPEDMNTVWDGTLDSIDDENEGTLADNDDTSEDLSDMDLADISDEDNAQLDNALVLNDNGELVLSENAENQDTDVDLADNTLDGEDAQDATDTGTDIPGEAVLASTTLDSGFFANAKLAREQTRSKNKQALMDIVADASLTDEQKQEAVDGILKMTEIADKENAAELLLEAKGFEGVVVNIVDGNVDVVVNAEYITDAQIAQIEDIVTRKAEVTVDKLVITSVIVEE